MITLKAPAKINWSLFVLDKREDGYHNILSLMQCVGLYDTLEFELSDCITLESDLDLPCGHNLVFKAATLLKRHSGTGKGVKIRLNKGIPPGSGLGGGSSDAAYTLIALNDLWELGLDKDELKTIGSALGSDVPFFFDGPLAIVEGRGERSASLPVGQSYSLLLVKADCSVSTLWAYGALDVEEHGRVATKTLENKLDDIHLIYRSIAAGDIHNLARNAHNDFEPVVIQRYPAILAVKERLLKNGAAMALMSGSGSTVFGLFNDERDAVNASSHFPSFFCKAVKTLC